MVNSRTHRGQLRLVTDAQQSHTAGQLRVVTAEEGKLTVVQPHVGLAPVTAPCSFAMNVPENGIKYFTANKITIKIQPGSIETSLTGQ
jgi:hypothetical protein